MSYVPVSGELFHVHTYRCRHAGNEQDYEYVEAAVKLGAPRIVFTDHVPFPDNPLKNNTRMDYEQLPEYISSMQLLKEKYSGKIELLCGLEVEYLPSYQSYFEALKDTPGIDLLIVGQHFFEHEPGKLSLYDEDKTYAFIGQCEAMAQAINTGLFDVIAHPDRSFRACDVLGEREYESADRIIEALSKSDDAPYLEKNVSSWREARFYKPEFWERLPESTKILTGLDAHSVKEMIDGWQFRFT